MIVTVKEGDNRWLLTDGVVQCPRAAFEISNNCPHGISRIIIDAINNGYLKPVAYVRRQELTWEALL